MKEYLRLHNETGLIYLREKYIESAQPHPKVGTLISMVSGTTVYVTENMKDIKW